ncbi:phosphate signaling complex protein PhoU [Holdemania filiformis]|uniref:phosphate signaling complex protein PhoU n=1 Tax=Holdemania filiformis TaxID=61171 RepID=UPI0026770734|nr:phosphate signaling complex protein PhoU [Holdemania filiformis]
MKMDESLAAFQSLILQMYRKVKMMHELALDILRSGDKEKALQLIYMDDFVNHLEEEINDQAQTVLALLSPVATDLRKVIAGIKIASDLERIGDYAKNIADYVIKKGPAEPPFVGEQAEAIGRLFLEMLDAAMDAYQKEDVAQAYQIPRQDEQINDQFAELSGQIETAVMQGMQMEHVVPLVAMLRNFERAGDHTKNICEHLIYQVKGQHIDFG